MATKPKPKPQSGPNDERTVPEDEKRFVSTLLSRVQRAVDLRKKFDTETLPKLRRLVWGTLQSADSTATTERINLIFATIAAMIPHVYAKNPEIAVSPSEAVDEAEYPTWKAFCETAQVFLNRMLIDEGGLKRRAKSNVRSAMTTSIGWLKLTFQESLTGSDPIIIRRVNDAQDNLRRIEYLIGSIKKTPDVQNAETKREELKNQLRALMESNEVKVFKGFAIDRVQTEDIFILDESVVDFDDYVHAKQIAHRIWMTDEEFEETFGHKPLPGTQEYGHPGAGNQTDDYGSAVQVGESAAKGCYRAVFEVWDRTSNTIYTVAMGAPGYCRAPYVPKPSSQRWYSFFGLGFNLVEGRFRPLSDVELLMKLQEEYSTTRYLYAEARKEAIPTRVFRKSGSLTEEDLNKLVNRNARDWIGIEGNPQTPLAQEFLQLEGIKIDPAAYDVSLIRNDMDMVVGMSDAGRANLIQAKTATEAEIMRQAMNNRVAERQDTNEDLISDMARAALEIGLQKFTKAEIEEIVGAGAEWPEQLPVEQIFHKIRVHVRAGSTGRPNQQKERETWTNLMPVISDTAKQVAELRAAGSFDLADTQVELLRETLRRFDERLDVDELIPPLQKDEQGQPQAAQNALAKAQEMQAALEQLQQELQACQQELEKKERELEIAKQADLSKAAEAEAKGAIETARESTRQTEASAKAGVESERARLERETKEAAAAREAETERYKAKLQLAGQLYVARMTPHTSTDAEGNASASATPDPNAVVNEIAQVIARIDAAASEPVVAPPAPITDSFIA